MSEQTLTISQEEAEEAMMRRAHRRRAPRRIVERPGFQLSYVTVPLTWCDRLWKARSPNTVNLALAILIEAFRVSQTPRGKGEIVLSARMTGLSSSNRHRAIQELEKLGLIRLRKQGRHAPRVELKRLGPSVSKWTATGRLDGRT